MFKAWLDRIPPFLKNKFLLVGVVFVVWIVFIDRNNLISQFRLQKQLKKVKSEAKYLLRETEKDSAALHELLSDSMAMEKVAREKYLMKRDSEDIFIIVRKPAPTK